MYFPISFMHSIFSRLYRVSSRILDYTSVGFGVGPGFLAVTPQVTLLINPVVGFRYFLPGPRLLSQANRSPPLGQYQIMLLGDRGKHV